MEVTPEEEELVRLIARQYPAPAPPVRPAVILTEHGRCTERNRALREWASTIRRDARLSIAPDLQEPAQAGPANPGASCCQPPPRASSACAASFAQALAP